MADKDSREGKRYQTPEIIKYVNETHASHDAGLAGAFAVPEGIPAIQVGPSEGKLLYLLLRMINAKKVVEVGTLVGYSAIHMARALPADGHLYSIEFDAKHADVSRKNIERAGLADRKIHGKCPCTCGRSRCDRNNPARRVASRSSHEVARGPTGPQDAPSDLSAGGC